MKPYEELTIQEKAALTDDEFDYYCKLACAEAGAPICPKDPGPKPAGIDIKPTLTVYEVADGFCTKQEDAMAIAEAMNRCTRYHSYSYLPGRYDLHYLGDTCSKVDVKPIQVLTQEEADSVKKSAVEAAAKMKEWTDDNERYNKEVKARESAIEWIVDDHADAITYCRGIERKREAFKEYLSLANGDRETAIRFFNKAYSPAIGELDEVLAPITPETTE